MQDGLAGSSDKVKEIQHGLTMPQAAFRNPLRCEGELSQSHMLVANTHAVHSNGSADPFMRIDFLHRFQPLSDMRLKEDVQFESTFRPGDAHLAFCVTQGRSTHSGQTSSHKLNNRAVFSYRPKMTSAFLPSCG